MEKGVSNDYYLLNRIHYNPILTDSDKVYRLDLRKVVLSNNLATIDLRSKVNFTFQEMFCDELDDTDECMYEIIADLNGEEIGFMNFTVNIGKSSEELNELLIKSVEINDNVRGIGIGQLMYKEFGEIYEDKFKGIPVSRFFVNPIAEYSFRKAVSLGWVSQDILDENRIKRDYSKDDKENLWIDLRNKLPEEYRGA